MTSTGIPNILGGTKKFNPKDTNKQPIPKIKHFLNTDIALQICEACKSNKDYDYKQKKLILKSAKLGKETYYFIFGRIRF